MTNQRQDKLIVCLDGGYGLERFGDTEKEVVQEFMDSLDWQTLDDLRDELNQASIHKMTQEELDKLPVD